MRLVAQAEARAHAASSQLAAVGGGGLAGGVVQRKRMLLIKQRLTQPVFRSVQFEMDPAPGRFELSKGMLK